MVRCFLFFLFLLLFSRKAFSQREMTVKEEYIYYAPRNISPEEAERIAIERAKINAIANAFGTIVSQNNSTFIASGNGKSQVEFFSLGGSEVKGEWIETIGIPRCIPSFEKGMLVVKAIVEGRIREIISAPLDFKAKVLCNGTEDKFERDEFKDGDDLYLSFQSPVDGYLAVYLLDNNRRAYCLLPYRNNTEGRVCVKCNIAYVFFSSKHVPAVEASLVDEYTLTCDRSNGELNQIFIIFSPNLFTKALDNDTDSLLPRELDYEDFQKWLVNCRKRDKEMRVETKYITIKNNNGE